MRAAIVERARRLAGRPRLLPITALLLRAHTVRPAVAFVMRALLSREGTFVYRLRESGLRIALRHGTGDLVTLGEVFHQHDYRPPAEVQESLGHVARILDLGANVGLFGAFAASRWPEAEIVAFEPDPANASVHAQTIALNQLQSRWQLVRSAAGSSNGQARFVAGDVALSRLAGADDALSIEVSIEDVLPRMATSDLVKMDIEGGEWAILCDERFRASPPRTLVLEYHPRFCAAENPREAAEAALSAAGLHVHSIWHRADGHGMLWAWQS